MYSLEEAVKDLEDCARDGQYYEIEPEVAGELAALIRHLQRQADRDSRRIYPDTTGS